MLLGFLFAVALSLPLPAFSYIPASATNSTQDAIAGGLNVTDISTLQMQWFSNGSYSIHVSYQLAGNGSSGLTKGVLVHFSEDMADNMTPPTSTPWIALVSCDKNATNASMEEDIFTLARDKGAVSALLYSNDSTACVINPGYSDPNTFDKVFDIFSTQSLTTSRLIEYQFGQLGPHNKSLLAYDSAKLNNSRADISASILGGSPVSAGYLLAFLKAYNSTDEGPGPTISNTDASTPPAASHSPNTALAMIILYAITGCVSALFIIVIISGAIRAIRHPERYGPRARMAFDGALPQSRARGLTRAILDTFPVVKFGGTSPSQQGSGLDKDATSRSSENQMEMGKVNSNDSDIPVEVANTLPESGPANPPHQQENINQADSPERDMHPRPVSPTSHHHVGTISTPDLGEGSSRDVQSASPPGPRQDDLVPASIGRETCPICIVDFEEGDDLRVLPCEGKHCFHQACVDPWLLKLSSSCPICRHDFLALETMLSGHPDDEDEEVTPENPSGHQPLQSNTGRFSRYLRFAHRRQRRRRGDEQDPTDPYMPTAPETSIYPGA